MQAHSRQRIAAHIGLAEVQRRLVLSNGAGAVAQQTVNIAELFEQQDVGLTRLVPSDECQRRVQVEHGIVIGVQSNGLVGGLPVVMDGLVAQASQREMMGQQAVQPLQAIRINRLHRFAHAPVKIAPPFEQDRLVDRFLCQRVAEGVFDLGHARGLADHFEPQQRREPLVEFGARLIHRLQDALVERPPDDRCDLKRATRRLLETIHPRR